MGRSFARAGTEAALENYSGNNTYYHKASDRYYKMYRRDGKLYQRRHQIAFGRQETNIVDKEVHFVMGSGNQLDDATVGSAV